VLFPIDFENSGNPVPWTSGFHWLVRLIDTEFRDFSAELKENLSVGSIIRGLQSLRYSTCTCGTVVQDDGTVVQDDDTVVHGGSCWYTVNVCVQCTLTLTSYSHLSCPGCI
jgi:hypothetical protein